MYTWNKITDNCLSSVSRTKEGTSKWWLRDDASVLLFIDIYLDLFFYLCVWEDEWDIEGKSKWWLRDNDSVLLFIAIHLGLFFYFCIWWDEWDI